MAPRKRGRPPGSTNKPKLDAAGNPIPRAPKAPGGSLAGALHKPDGGLDKALGAAGFATGDAPTAPVAEAPAGLPPITPEQLVAVLAALNGMVCRTAATIWQVKLDKAEIARLCTMTGDEKEILTALAPYAADYAPELMAQMKPIMAGTFVAAYLVMTGTRVWDIRGMRKPPLTRAAKAAPEYQPPPVAKEAHE